MWLFIQSIHSLCINLYRIDTFYSPTWGPTWGPTWLPHHIHHIYIYVSASISSFFSHFVDSFCFRHRMKSISSRIVQVYIAQPCKRAKWARKCRNIQLENIYLHGNECLSIRNKQEMRTSSAYRVKITPSQTKCSWALRACVCVFVRFVCTFNAFKIWQLNNKSSYILFGWCWLLFK